MISPAFVSLELPQGWEIAPLKAFAKFSVSNVDKISKEGESSVRLCNYTDVFKNDFISASTMKFMKSTASETEIDKFGLNENDVVITKDSEAWDEIAIPALVADTASDLVCGYHLAILRSNEKFLLGRFLFRCLQSKAVRLELELESKGVTRFGLPKGAIGELKLPIPPLAHQQVISTYLDRETDEIDALIAEKQRMLELLEEKRAALVTQAVTQGLNPRVAKKPSGLPWLGDVPKHWDVMRCAALFTQLDERGEGHLPLLLVSINSGVSLRQFSEDRIERVMADADTYKIARQGQLAFNKMRFWQGAAGIAPEDGLVSPDYTVAKFNKEELQPRYVELLMRIPTFSNEVRRYSHGIVDDRLRLYWDEFKDIQIPVPPYDEQVKISNHIDVKLEENSEVTVVLNQSIELLKERRSALITAAVTGQIPLEKMEI